MKFAIAILAAFTFVAPVLSQNAPAPMTVDDVVTLFKAGISESVLVTRIKQSNKPSQLSTDDLLKLAQAKVPDTVIQALMNPGPNSSNNSPMPAALPPNTSVAPVTNTPPPNGRGAARSPSPANNATTDTNAEQANAVPTNPNITVRAVLLPKSQIDSKKKELDAKNPPPKPKGGLAGRFPGSVTNILTGDENRRKAAESVLHQQAHDVLVRENKTVVVAIGGKDVVAMTQQYLSDVKREIILLHLDPSVTDKTNDNGAIHDGLTAGITGMATNIWVYLRKSATSPGDVKPDQMFSSKAPGQKQVWTALFAADGDLPPQIDNKLK